MTGRPRTPRAVAGAHRRRSLWGAAMVGVGLMAGLDEIVFHQLLGWHHLYDGSTSEVALLSDGLLHAAELALLVAGAVLLGRLGHRRVLHAESAWAGVLLGMGGFQLFDGIVVHKVLGLHQIRYGVDLLPYDLAWNAAAVVLLLLGGLLTRRARRPARSGVRHTVGKGLDPHPR